MSNRLSRLQFLARGPVGRVTLLSRAVILCSLLAVLSIDRAGAEGSVVEVSPTSGPSGTAVELTGTLWLPDVEVAISAGYTEDIHYGAPVVFGDVIATTTSDDEGNWTAEAVVGEDVPIPERPGFVQFRADSEDLPAHFEGFTTATFALMVDGQRPNGAGGIHVTVSKAPELDTRLVFLSYRRAGIQAAFRNIYPPPSLPAEFTFSFKLDGDYEVAAAASGDLLPVGPGLRDVIAPVCDEYPACEGLERLFRVQEVSIRNGEVVDVHISFGGPDELPSGGYGPSQSGGLPWSWPMAIIALATAGSLLFSGGALKVVLNSPARAKRRQL